LDPSFSWVFLRLLTQARTVSCLQGGVQIGEFGADKMAEASSSSAQAASAGKKRSIDDFEVAQTLGEEAYGAVRR
jgi:hypothetical protein